MCVCIVLERYSYANSARILFEWPQKRNMLAPGKENNADMKIGHCNSRQNIIFKCLANTVYDSMINFISNKLS